MAFEDVLSSLRVPPSRQCQAWLDFDGTVSRQDVLDELVVRYSVNDSWKAIERRWQRGEIGSRQCLSDQFDLLRVTPGELDKLLGGIDLDPGALTLFGLLAAQEVPTMILSDCVDFFIRRILARHGLHHVPARSNTAVFHGDRLALSCPYENPKCSFAAAHCKCASMNALGRHDLCSIFVGDGRSDLCASRHANLVFAKGVLADCLDRESIPYVRYSTLHDVADVLSRAWQVPAVQARASA